MSIKNFKGKRVALNNFGVGINLCNIWIVLFFKIKALSTSYLKIWLEIYNYSLK